MQLAWDLLRLLHSLYPRAPGLHLEGFLIVDASTTIFTVYFAIRLSQSPPDEILLPQYTYEYGFGPDAGWLIIMT